MASPRPLSPYPPLSILALPAEIDAAILTHLAFEDLHTLRLTHRYFYALIPPPTHTELLAAERQDFALSNKLLACVGCTRLRPMHTFSRKMFMQKKDPGGAQARNRFCIECGRRPLPGLHRYMRGSRWEEDGVPFVRCMRCSHIVRAPEDKKVQVCLACHRQDLERKRAAEELKRVRREAEEREERRRLRAERGLKRIETGCGAWSDSFSEDTSEEEGYRGYGAHPDDWGQEDDLNYSAHS